MRTGTLAAWACVAAALIGAGCAPESEPADAPRWIHLVEDYEPQLDSLAPVLAEGPGWEVGLEREGGVDWLCVRYFAESWSKTPLPGVWSAPGVTANVSGAASGDLIGFQGERRLVRIKSFGEEALASDDDGVFGFLGDTIMLRSGDSNRAPEGVRLLVRAPFGHPDGSRWRIDVGHVAGDGFCVFPQHSESFVVPPGENRSLTFGYFAVTDAANESAIDFRILQDGNLLWSRRATPDAVADPGLLAFDSVELGDLTTTGELTFEVDGPFAYTGFVSPVVGPRARGATDRAARDDRPNLVLFVADTFRADNLSPYRALADAPREILFPTLEELVSESTVFENSWSSSTWTLPSHASLFTSLHPLQHNATDPLGSLSESAVTLAETLRSAGYRTVAVTDGSYVASGSGLAQGFEVFDQVSRTGPQPLERARRILEVSDGRPTFLFVQSYFTHAPFQPTPRGVEHVATLAPVTSLESSNYAELVVAIDARRERDDEKAFEDGLFELRRRYLAQVADFDRELRTWLDALDAQGWRETTHLFFTSDHGEAFGDHGVVRHPGPPWESLTRVPLLWSGPDVVPGTRADAASSVDVAPTLARLAGVTPPEAWRGRDLAREDSRAIAWSNTWTRAPVSPDPRGFPLITAARGDSKLFVDRAEEREFAFHLGRDPDELVELDSDEPSWPAALAGRVRERLPTVERVHLPLMGRADLGPGLLDQLRAMGYLGEE